MCKGIHVVSNEYDVLDINFFKHGMLMCSVSLLESLSFDFDSTSKLCMESGHLDPTDNH